MFIPRATTSRNEGDTHWLSIVSRTLGATAEPGGPPRLGIPGIIAVSVAGSALLLLGSAVFIIHRWKRQAERPQASVDSASSGRPLLYSSNASPRETFTTMSHRDSFFSHVPVSTPASAYGSGSSTSRQPSYGVHAMVVRPLTGEPDDSLSPDPDSRPSSSRQRQGARKPPRRTSRWSHLPPIPTIREASSEESHRDEVCLPGTRGSAPTRTTEARHHRRSESDLSSTVVKIATPRVSREATSSEVADAEGSEPTTRNIIAPSSAPARTRASQDDLALLSPPTRQRTSSSDSSSSRFVVQDHPALNRGVVKPRATYARPGRLISGQGNGRV